MEWRNTRAAWGWGAIALHWLVAVLVVGNWILGATMTDLADADPAKFARYQLHKSFGLTIFAVAALRLLWRLVNPTPELPDGMRPWERLASRASHALLYLLLILQPLTGYLMVSSSSWGIPTLVFGTLHVPHLLGPDPAVEKALKAVHDAQGTLLAALVLIHSAAALKHHFVDRDAVLRRMVGLGGTGRPA